MTSPTKRRPLPALVFLLALTLLAALVWWRVLHRDSGHSATKPTCTTKQQPKQLPQPGGITLTVLNSTKRQGIATAARKALLRDGFHVPGIAKNDEKSFGYHGVIPQVAELRHGPLGASAARLVAYYLPGAKLVSTKATDSTVTISLGLKYKAPASKAKVAAALKADGITLVRTTGAPETSASPSASC